MDGPVMEELFKRCGGAEGRVLIVPTASDSIRSGEGVVQALTALGMKTPPRTLPILQRADASDPDYLKALKEATGLFFCGGAQLRLTAVLGGTPFHHTLLEAYEQGLVVAGTSAGMAALSSTMIAHGHSGISPRQSICQFSPGLGFTDRLLFDQHFSQRHRLGRLIYAVLSNPHVLGVGNDENTAAVIVDDTLSVVGHGAVTIVDGSEMVESDVAELEYRELVAYSGIKMHLLKAGCTFHLLKRSAFIPIKKTNSK